MVVCGDVVWCKSLLLVSSSDDKKRGEAGVKSRDGGIVGAMHRVSLSGYHWFVQSIAGGVITGVVRE
ncbi:hypothetical protein Tco_0686842 [Tanacetum coccineum]|uniref:Uncharacterized protein n=1 Tax=Tanacetum coccineum TaxID=301880 RepID=A0ABQ4XE48_9ASTR